MRGAGAGMIFQEPMSALNPAFTVGSQIAEALGPRLENLERPSARTRGGTARQGRHRRTGACAWGNTRISCRGMRQQVMIAMAIARRPALLIADEPTTALDVTTQAQVLRLLRGLQEETGGPPLVTDDLALASMIADRVIVIYAGRIRDRRRLGLLAPRRPHSWALLERLPVATRRAPGPSGVRRPPSRAM